MNYLKYIFKLIIFFGLLFFLPLSKGCKDMNTYEVELTFCDMRSPDTVMVETYHRPETKHIQNYKLALPEYKGYLNVCSIKVLRRLK